VLDHDEQVVPAEEDGVDVGEVDREDRVGLCRQELSPGTVARSGPTVAGLDRCQRCSRSFSGRGGDPVAEPDELALDASIAPGRILAGHPQHQRPERLRNG
jgi:hypothetical protein